MIDNKKNNDRMAERIAQRLTETGKTAAAVSKAAGYKPDFIRDFLTGRKSGMAAAATVNIARELGVTVAWLQGDDDAMPEAVPVAPMRSISVFSTVAGALEDRMHKTGEIIQVVPCPHGLVDVFGVYAFYVVRNQMEPRYRQGDIVFVTPHRPARPGEDVVIVVKGSDGDASSFIREFVGEQGSTVLTLQHNPRREEGIERADIIEMHRIAPINDLIGV